TGGGAEVGGGLAVATQGGGEVAVLMRKLREPAIAMRGRTPRQPASLVPATASVYCAKARLLGHDALRNLCRARDLLSDVHEAKLSIEQVAREVAISPYHFIRQFEAVFGMTPHQYRIRQRLELAKHLLAAGQHSVTDVCMEVGFSSLGSFSALFAHRVGVP